MHIELVSGQDIINNSNRQVFQPQHISNYPSFNDHIHPPSRFSDDTECEGHHRRKRHEKVPREAFQINV
ncbi:hypothetical protein MSG28_008698 [Choristoneura fumiferana]|uniref:Uncharacterized protein n=1 Tax=Choristoneura fumiferana TaxID=7141 RepID=A0ACC0J7M7_CHOFU|nr:hypothetical protein MSG28_008698 [Choristoneura fumiferana]